MPNFIKIRHILLTLLGETDILLLQTKLTLSYYGLRTSPEPESLQMQCGRTILYLNKFDNRLNKIHNRLRVNNNGEVVLSKHRVMKVQGGRGNKTPCILNLGPRWSITRSGQLTPCSEPSTGQQVMCLSSLTGRGDRKRQLHQTVH